MTQAHTDFLTWSRPARLFAEDGRSTTITVGTLRVRIDDCPRFTAYFCTALTPGGSGAMFRVERALANDFGGIVPTLRRRMFGMLLAEARSQ